MAPAVMLGSYLQYKHDTDVVASWLATTSKKLGYSAPFSAAPDDVVKNQQSSRGRLKGKARKDAKKSQAASANLSQVTAAKQHILAVRDFIPLTEHIAAKRDQLKGKTVPVSFASALARAISTRQTYADAFGEGRDSSHAYFLGVLKSVQEILSPLFPEPSTSRAAKTNVDATSADSASLDTANLFARLTLHEPSEEFVNAPDITPPDPVDLTFSMEKPVEDKAEFAFALYEFLEDTIEMRRRLKPLWRWASELSHQPLRSAAVATNTAIQLVRAMEQAITPLIERNGGTETAMLYMFEIVCKVQCKEVDDPLQGEDPKDMYNFACYDVAQEYLWNTHCLLQCALENFGTVPRNKLPDYNHSQGSYDENRTPSGNRQKFDFDAWALLEMATDRTQLDYHPNLMIVDDELQRGIRIMNDTKKVPIWLCFAAQVHLDILGVMGESLSTAFGYCISNLKELDESVPKVSDVSHVEADLQRKIKKYHAMSEAWTTVRTSEAGFAHRLRFLKYNPLYSGLLMNHMGTWYHDLGLSYAYDNWALQSTVQLLHALEQTSAIDPGQEWEYGKEIQHVRSRQPTSTFFIGDPPVDAKGHFRNYSLTVGVSITEMVDTGRKLKYKRTRTRRSPAGLRSPQDGSPLSRFLMSRFTRRNSNEPISMDALQQLLERLQGSEIPEQMQKLSTGPLLSASDVVFQVGMAVLVESAHMYTDYFEASDVSVEMLKELCGIINPVFGVKHLVNSSDHHSLSHAVGNYLAALAGGMDLRNGWDLKRLEDAVVDMVSTY